MAAKKREDRYQSATALIADLANWQNVAPSSGPMSGDDAVRQNVLNAIFDD
jgi:hypothetical protein